MAYGSSITDPIPTVGTTPGPTYATQINAFLATVQTTLEAKVTPAGFDMTSDLSFLSSSATNYRATDLKAVSFEDQGSPLSGTNYPASLYFSGNELYANDGAGNQVQVTSGGALDVSAVSGITGAGYGSSGVEVNWDSGNQAYHFYYDKTATTYADVYCDDLKLYDGSSNYITFVAPAISADYTVTWPTAVPASTSVMTMNSSGTIATTRDPSVDTVTASGLTTTNTLTVNSTSTLTGAVTATAGVTLGSNANVTLSGTGKVIHGSRVLHVHPFSGSTADPTSNFPVAGSGWVVLGSTTVEWCVSIPLVEGNIITQIVFGLIPAGSGTKTFHLRSVTKAGTTTTHETITSSSAVTTSHTMTVSPEVTITAGSSYFIDVKAGNATDEFTSIEVTYYQS